MPPVKYEGRTWIRTGPRRSIANEQEERILIERRRNKLLPFDLHPVFTTTIHDLSKVFFEEEYLPRAFAADILAANGRTYKERLAACRMMVAPDEPTPTVTGILTLCKTPQKYLPCARVQFLRIQGVCWGDDVIDEQRIDGPLYKQLEQLDQKLISHNRVAVDIASAATEIRRYCYPLSALQQLTRNALMHRSYEGTNAPVMVYWFDDRIEIINAGGPFGRVTPENFGKPGFADYRNPTIAETMKILGFVQRFGVGIQMAQKDLKVNGNPPAEFKCDLTSVLCTVWQSSNFPAIEINAATSQPELQPDSQPESIGKRLLILLSNGTLAKSALSAQLGQKNISGQLNKVIRQLLADELIEYTNPVKPNSRLQKYRITEKGKRWLQRPEGYHDHD